MVRVTMGDRVMVDSKYGRMVESLVCWEGNQEKGKVGKLRLSRPAFYIVPYSVYT